MGHDGEVCKTRENVQRPSVPSYAHPRSFHFQRFGRMIRRLVCIGFIGLALPSLSCRTPGPVSTVNTFSTIAAIPLGITGKPRLRMGRSPTGAVIGPDIGKHGYTPNLSERNGIVFTCRAGQIDTAHTRKTADWTYYLAKEFMVHLENNRTSFTYKMPEPLPVLRSNGVP